METKHLTKRIVRTLFLFGAIALYCNSYSQTNGAVKDLKEVLLTNQWVTDNILGLDPKVDTYKLTKYNPQGKFAGNITQFLDSATFSAYTAWCGNDYFTDLLGQYKFPDKNKIAITVKEVSYSGEWTKPTEHRKPDYMTFAISMVGDTIVLRKQ